MYENFPYSNFHDLNTDWIIKKIKDVETSEANAKASEENAKTSEENAKQYEESAEALTEQASTHAINAREYAQAAAQSATEANNYVSSTREQVNLLQSRVDNIIPSGTQTEGNTELLDIRVAEDEQIYDSAGNAVRGQISNLKNALNQIKDNVFDVSVNLFDKSAIEVGVLNVYGIVSSSLPSFSTSDFMPVNAPNIIAIQNNNKVTQDRYYICEYDANKSFIGAREELLLGINVTFGTYELIQSNTKYIRISYMPQNTPTDSLMVFVGTSRLPIYQPYGQMIVKDSFSEQIKTPIGVNIENEQLSIITKYKNGYDLCVKFNKHGANNLPDFASLGLIENEDFYPTTEASSSVPFITITTDIHAPYIVKAVNNIDGDLPNSEHFTGGNHNYNNNAEQGYTPTATCDSLKYYVDGNEVTEYVGYAKSVKAVWINSVQATNTKKADGTGRNVLKETHTLEFKDGKWHSTVEIETLEDVLIKTYYGFQWIMNAVYPNIRFIGGANRGLYNNTQVNTSGNNVVNGMKIFGTDHSAQIDLDTTYDIGNRRYYSGTSGAYNSTVKSYFYLMSNVTASANDLYCAKADFIFSAV